MVGVTPRRGHGRGEVGRLSEGLQEVLYADVQRVAQSTPARDNVVNDLVDSSVGVCLSSGLTASRLTFWNGTVA